MILKFSSADYYFFKVFCWEQNLIYQWVKVRSGFVKYVFYKIVPWEIYYEACTNL